MYLITPLIAKLIDKSKHRIIPAIILIAICLAVSTLPIDSLINETKLQEVIINIQSVRCRVSGFILGYYGGEHVRNKKQIFFLLFP